MCIAHGQLTRQDSSFEQALPLTSPETPRLLLVQSPPQPSHERSVAMPIQRPVSAPAVRLSQQQPVERLLDLHDLVKDESHHELARWFCGLSVTNRARARWVFKEPEGLAYPRQRARREIMEITHLDDLEIYDPEGAAGVARHNKCQWAPAIKGEPLEAWKNFALRTTNQDFQKVPEPDPYFSRDVWFRMMRKSHGGLLRPGGLDLIEKWSEESTLRQRHSLSELLHSFNGHLTSRRGRSETKTAYGWPGLPETASIHLTDPFSSSLGRPSSAPIAHAVQRNFEKKKRQEAAAQAALAQKLKMERLARPKRQAFERPEVDTLKSQVHISMYMCMHISSGHVHIERPKVDTLKNQVQPHPLSGCPAHCLPPSLPLHALLLLQTTPSPASLHPTPPLCRQLPPSPPSQGPVQVGGRWHHRAREFQSGADALRQARGSRILPGQQPTKPRQQPNRHLRHGTPPWEAAMARRCPVRQVLARR